MAMIDTLWQIHADLKPYYDQFDQIPVIQTLTTLDHLKALMTQHVFLVWDFNSLLQALLRGIAPNTTPWVPFQDPAGVRLLYDIVMSETTDLLPGRAHPTSHFEWYLEAMAEIGADTRPIQQGLGALKSGETLEAVLSHSGLLPATRQFVQHTFSVIEGPLPELTATFVFGREAMVPAFFRPLLEKIQQHNWPHTQTFQAYLSHHITVDSDDHFPKALELLAQVCEGQGTSPDRVAQAARQALSERLDWLKALSVSQPGFAFEFIG